MVHPPLLSLASAMLSMEYCNMSDSLEPRKSRVKRQTDVFDLSHDITVIFMVSLLSKLDNILPCQYWCIDRGNDWLIVMQLAARRGFTATRLGWKYCISHFGTLGPISTPFSPQSFLLVINSRRPAVLKLPNFVRPFLYIFCISSLWQPLQADHQLPFTPLDIIRLSRTEDQISW